MTAKCKEKGQGLVEMAFILTFLLVLVIGIVEGSVVLREQLVVVNAAREGARFGAFGAAPEDIIAETRYAASYMLELNETNSTIVVVEIELNEDGTDFAKWEETACPPDATSGITQKWMLENLATDAGGLRLVVVVVRYDHHSLFGFPTVGALADRIPIRSWTVMRVF